MPGTNVSSIRFLYRSTGETDGSMFDVRAGWRQVKEVGGR